MRFLVDENLPFSLIALLRHVGHDVLDVASSSLRGHPDDELWTVAHREQRILVTKDIDFPLRHLRPFPPGLVLVRVPDTFTGQQITELFAKLITAPDIQLADGSLVVLTPARVRTRRLE
ncbi:MAG: DUF5615 family PIN-like protein [Nitrospirota bacterium]